MVQYLKKTPRSQETTKSAKRTKKSRDKHIIDSSVKTVILNRIQDALRAGVGIGYNKFFIVGSNSISKQLELNNVNVVALSRDAHELLHRHVIEAACLRKVSICYLPRCSEDLAKVFSVRKCSCFALTKLDDNCTSAVISSSLPITSENSMETKEQNITARAIMDDIAEMLLTAANWRPGT